MTDEPKKTTMTWSTFFSGLTTFIILAFSAGVAVAAFIYPIRWVWRQL